MFPALSSLYFLTTHFLDPLLFSGSLCFLDIVLTISRKNRIKTITVSPVRRRPFRKNKFGRLDPPFFNLCSNYRKFLRPIDSFLIRMFRTFPLLWANLVCFHIRRYESSFSFISSKANIWICDFFTSLVEKTLRIKRRLLMIWVHRTLQTWSCWLYSYGVNLSHSTGIVFNFHLGSVAEIAGEPILMKGNIGVTTNAGFGWAIFLSSRVFSSSCELRESIGSQGTPNT